MNPAAASPATGFADLHRDLVFGRAGGRVIWQPRIACWVTDKQYAEQPLPPPLTGLDFPGIYRALNVSARLYEYNACFKPVEPASVRYEDRALNDVDVETVIHTPVGVLTEVRRRMVRSKWRERIKRPICAEPDLRVATWLAEHTGWRWDQAAFERVAAHWGDLGAPTIYMPRVNIQELFVNAMGVESTIYALTDWPAAVEGYFRALDDLHDRLIAVINVSPIDIINFGDNVHAGTIGPALFRRYVLPAYRRRCEKLHAAGKFVHAHWDGDTRALLPLARETGLDGIEAITPQPQGDVTLEEMKAGLGDTMFLLDGIPAIYFDETFSLATLSDFTRRLLDLFAPKLVLGISDEMSSTGNIERIEVVSGIVNDYNRGIGGGPCPSFGRG